MTLLYQTYDDLRCCCSKRVFPVENRKSSRYPLICPISFSGDHMAGEGLVVNISAQGCLIGTHKNAQERTQLTLRVSLPDEASPVIVEQAVVRWSMEREFGVEFLRMQPEEQARLSRFVRTLEARPSHSRIPT